MPYWEALGRIAIAKEDQATSDRITQFLNYSGVDAAISYDSETSMYYISVPSEQADAARRLLDSFEDSRLSKKDHLLCAPRVLHEPVFVSEEDRFKDTTSAAMAFLVSGAVIFVASISRCLFYVHDSRELTSSDIILLWLGICFLGFGIYTMNRARTIRSQIIEEDRFITEIIEWFVSTYTAAQLDECIRAACDSPYSTIEERRTRRIQLIEDYIDREISLKNVNWRDYLTQEIYVSIFEKPKIKASP